ncbi:CopL family metal-binding regulatory protein, partial [Xanthomonas hortorum]|uniref:CopL family metal-binding regulatory protein n=1 Tax=Xanthomonas hortorum TaxID=56454 RepID=UPI002FE0ED40
MLRCLLRLLLCLCLVANTATGAWASVGMAMPAMASGAMAPAASAAQASTPGAMPCHADMQPTAGVPTHDTGKPAHSAHRCKLRSCDVPP